MSSSLAKEIGEENEYAIATGADDLELVGDGEATWYDARRDDGTPVEIKTCAFRIPDGGSSRRGRFLIKQAAHEKLLEEDGRYRLGVYLQSDREIIVIVDVPADFVDDVIGDSWMAAPQGRSYDEYAQIRWAELIDPNEIEEHA